MGHGGRAQIVSIRYFHTLNFYGAFEAPGRAAPEGYIGKGIY